MNDFSSYLQDSRDWSSALDFGYKQPVASPTMGVDPLGAPMLAGSAPVTGAGGTWFDNMWDSMLTKKDGATNETTQGWGGLALGAAQGLGNLWMGSQQLKMAKDSLSESKRQFNLNYDNQAQATNRQLEERQQARIASRPDSGYYQSVGDYMDKNRVKARG